MPQLTVEGVGTFEVPQGKRLVNALTDEAKIDQLHACGGNARCTTCRVQFVSGEPRTMTEAEKALLASRGLTAHAGLRLSCQILCDHDMAVKAISRLAGSGRVDAGQRPTDEINPPPVWTETPGAAGANAGR
jgi:ferredoxin